MYSLARKQTVASFVYVRKRKFIRSNLAHKYFFSVVKEHRQPFFFSKLGKAAIGLFEMLQTAKRNEAVPRKCVFESLKDSGKEKGTLKNDPSFDGSQPLEIR